MSGTALQNTNGGIHRGFYDCINYLSVSFHSLQVILIFEHYLHSCYLGDTSAMTDKVGSGKESEYIVKLNCWKIFHLHVTFVFSLRLKSSGLQSCRT